MSLNGWQQAELESQRKEQLRLERARTQANAVLAACNEAIAVVRDPAVQQLAAAGLRTVKQELKQAAGQIAQAPNMALKAVRRAEKHLHRVIADAEAAAHKWSQGRAKSEARIAELRAHAQTAKQTTNKAGHEALAQVDQAMAKARAHHQAGRYDEAVKRCDEATALIERADEASFDESVRREVVRGLLDTLEGMGFAVEGPRLVENDKDGGTVTLVGQLPSGRLARFEVQLDGRMSFDLDGYEGRTCGAELERIEHTLQEQFGVNLGPPQVTWKNPDKISKGSRDVPGGGQRRRAR